MRELIKSNKRIAILGHGTVGSALLQELEKYCEVTHVLVANYAKHESHFVGSDTKLTTDFSEIIDSSPDLICEAMGGIDPTYDYLVSALQQGISVITANKQLIAKRGDELEALAAKHSTTIRYEASVCGAIPVIRTLRESLAPSEITSISGIINGTTNFILTQMEATGADFIDALSEATDLGYAEADPTEDITGLDARAKLAILASCAFGVRKAPEEIRTTGIDVVHAKDIEFAMRFSRRIRLIGNVLKTDGDTDNLIARVSPMLISEDHPFASIKGATNAVLIAGTPFGELVLQGAGAGGPETASAMAADTTELIYSSTTDTPKNKSNNDTENMVFDPKHLAERKVAWYLRLHVVDQPGVLASITSLLSKNNISVDRIYQDHGQDNDAWIGILSHPAKQVDLDQFSVSVDNSEYLFTQLILPVINN